MNTSEGVLSQGGKENEPIKKTSLSEESEKDKKAITPVSEYLSGIVNNPAAFDEKTFDKKTLDTFPISSDVNDLATLSVSLLKLRNSGSSIPETILMKESFDMSALALDPRITLEGYIYDAYQNKAPLDPVKLQALPIVSQETLFIVLREMFRKDRPFVVKVADAILNRQQPETSRQFNITANFLRYVQGKMDPSDSKAILSGQANFFLKWPGWNQLTEDERQLLLKGSRIFEHYRNTPKDEFVKNIDTEISVFEAYAEEYKKTPLYTKWIGTIQLYFTLANLYALKGDYEKGGTFFDEAHKLKLGSGGPAPFYNVEMQAVGIREGYFYMGKARHEEALGKKKEALESYKKGAKAMKDNLMVRPFMIDGFAIWWDLEEKIKQLGG